MNPARRDPGSSLEAREIPRQGFVLPRMNHDKRVRLDDIAALRASAPSNDQRPLDELARDVIIDQIDQFERK